jgi:hypothetical protein
MNAAMPERRPMTEQKSGVIERVTFHNDDSGFCVLRVKTKFHREKTTVAGSLPSVTAGEWLIADGYWVRDREHGLQFKATMMKTVPPTTAEGVERYLGSGLVKGIGPILAKSWSCDSEPRYWRSSRTAPPNCNRRWHRPQAPGADRTCVAGGKATTGNHAVPA